MAEDYSIRVRIDPATGEGKDKVVSDFTQINEAADRAAQKAVNANKRIEQSYGQVAAAAQRAAGQTASAAQTAATQTTALTSATTAAGQAATVSAQRIAQSYGQTGAAAQIAAQQTAAAAQQATTQAATVARATTVAGQAAVGAAARTTQAYQGAAAAAATVAQASQTAGNAAAASFQRAAAAAGGGGFGGTLVNLNTQIQGVARNMGGLNGAMAQFTIAAGALSSIKVFSDFQDQMATVQSVALGTAEDLQKLEGSARELGRTTRFSATDAGKALEELARSGLDVKDTIGVLPTVLKLAQAENLSLAEASDIAAKSFRIFRTDVSDVPRLANQISQAATDSATNIRELFNALRYGGPIAAGFKIDSAEVLAAFGVLSDNAQSATVAGTELRGILSRIAAPTKEFEKDLKAVGLTLADINPQTHSLTEILTAMSKASVSTSEAFDLFKQRAGSGAEVLIKNLDRIREKQERIENAFNQAKGLGVLDVKFDIKADTLKNDLLLALAAVKELIITLGEAGLGRIIRTVLEVFAFTVLKISDLIRTLAPVLEAVGVAMAIAFSPVALAAFDALLVRIVFSTLPALLTAIYRIDAALVSFAVTNPFLAIIAAIGAVIVLFQQFGSEIRVTGTRYATVGDLFAVITDKIKTGFAAIVDSAATGFRLIASGAETMANGVLSIFQSLINKILLGLSNLQNAGTDLQNVFRDVLSLGTAAPLARTQASQVDFGRVALPDFAGDILKEADERALDRMAQQKAARADLIGKIHEQTIAQQRLDGTGNRTSGPKELDLVQQLLKEIKGPADDAKDAIGTLNDLFGDGTITASQYADTLQKLREKLLSTDQTIFGGIQRGLNQVAASATALGDQVSNFVVAAFGHATDAIVEFTKTGKLNISEFVRSVLADLVKLSTNALFGQIANGLLGTLGGGIKQGAAVPNLSGSFIGSLFGYAGGGDFVVGGSGGTDSQVVMFRATPGERGSIRTPQQVAREGRGGTIVNVINQSGAQVRTQQRQGAGGTEITDVIISAVDDGIARGRLDGSMSGRYGLGARQITR